MPGASGERIAAAAGEQPPGQTAALLRVSGLLTAKRITLHAALLAVCLWSVYAINLATPGLRDRAGHIKGADFLHFYTAGRLLQEGRERELYNPPALAADQLALMPQSRGDYFVASYGPQVYLPFTLLARLSYGWAALTWALINCCIYFGCCYAIWRVCPELALKVGPFLLLAVGYPGFFNLIAFGQTSGPALLLFTLAFLALRRRHQLLAGIWLGSLIYKPQLGLAAAVIFLLAAEWKVILGAIAGAAAQILFAWAWFGSAVMGLYFHALLRTQAALPFIEPKLYEMHSLRGFWLLLTPWRNFATALYIVSALAVLLTALMCWRSRAPLSLRYSALLLASVLVAPHLMAYDLVILAPAFVLLAQWCLEHPGAPARPALQILLYLCYALPLLEPLAKLSHIQLSVIGFVALQGLLWRTTKQVQTGTGHGLPPTFARP